MGQIGRTIKIGLACGLAGAALVAVDALAPAAGPGPAATGPYAGLPVVSFGALVRGEGAWFLGGLLAMLLAGAAVARWAPVRRPPVAAAALDQVEDAVLALDRRGRVRYANAAAAALLGGDPAGRPLAACARFVPARADAGTPPRDWRPPLEEEAVTCPLLPDPLYLLRPGGGRVRLQGRLVPLDGGWLLVLRDRSAWCRLQQQADYYATHDDLTGVLNRREFEHQLQRALAEGEATGTPYALVHLDLDRFEAVNESCGRAAGDRLLKEVGAALRGQLRNSDALARIGGDQFGCLLQGVTPEHAGAVAGKMLRAVAAHRFQWRGRPVVLGASAGVVCLEGGWQDAEQVLAAGERACRLAKHQGRGRVAFYAPDDARLVQSRGAARWLHRIQHALEEDRFVLYGQAIVPVDEGRGGPLYYEILLRMLDEDGQLVPPGAFLPAAERYGLMPAIDRWVIRHALGFIADPGNRLGDDVVYAINLSGQTLRDEGFVDFVLGALRDSGVAAARVCFEITETAAIENLQQAARLISRLRGNGCRFALDDFGAGMSSFAYLKNLGVDTIKIDGNFVVNMVDNRADHAMVEAINQVGHVMGMRTTAEFVENKSVLEALRRLGIDYAQGFGIQRPRPLAECLGMLEHSAAG